MTYTFPGIDGTKLSTVGDYRKKSTRYAVLSVEVALTMTRPQRHNNTTSTYQQTHLTTSTTLIPQQAHRMKKIRPQSGKNSSITAFFQPTTAQPHTPTEPHRSSTDTAPPKQKHTNPTADQPNTNNDNDNHTHTTNPGHTLQTNRTKSHQRHKAITGYTSQTSNKSKPTDISYPSSANGNRQAPNTSKSQEPRDHKGKTTKSTKPTKAPTTKQSMNNKDTDDASAATVAATNTATAASTSKANQNRHKSPKPTFNPWKTVGTGQKTTSGIPTNNTPLPKDFNFLSRCRLRWWHTGDKKTSKNNHRSFITAFLTQASNIDPTTTIFKFFSKDRIPPRIPTPPIQKPFQLPADHGNLQHYFPGRVPESTSTVSIMLYFGHTAEFQTIALGMAEWLRTRHATLELTPIQSEHATDLCWFVYSTKNTNCTDLGSALTHLLGFKVGLQFKPIYTGTSSKLKASAVHLLADEADTLPVMAKLNDIYSEARMNNRAADYPLGQRLLLAPMAKGLNDHNLAALLQLKTKQASFCHQVVTVTTYAIANLDQQVAFSGKDGQHHWSLRGLLMQVTHPTTDTCAFFQAIDKYSVGKGVVFTMLPSAAAYGRNAVLGIIPFTRWLLEPVYGRNQASNLDLAFTPEALQEMETAIWDQDNNCVQQKEGDLLGRALNDLGIYDLREHNHSEGTTKVLVDTTGTDLAETQTTTTASRPIHSSLVAARTSQNPSPDNDSLTNSIQSQTTMFTQAIHQMDDLAERQAKFEQNTQSSLDTIMQQLAELTRNTRKRSHNQQNRDNQHEYHDDNQDYLATDDSMEEDVGES